MNFVIRAPTTAAISSSLGKVVAFNRATRDFAMANDTRSLKLRNVTAPYCRIKVCRSVSSVNSNAGYLVHVLCYA